MNMNWKNSINLIKFYMAEPIDVFLYLNSNLIYWTICRSEEYQMRYEKKAKTVGNIGKIAKLNKYLQMTIFRHE